MNDIRNIMDNFRHDFLPQTTVATQITRSLLACFTHTGGRFFNFVSSTAKDVYLIIKFLPQPPVGPNLKKVHKVASEILCSICLEEANQTPCVVLHPQERTLERQHIFHEECIKRWFETHLSCPICRTELQTEFEASRLDEVMQAIRDHDDDLLHEVLSITRFTPLAKRMILLKATRSNDVELLKIVLYLLPSNSEERKEALELAIREEMSDEIIRCFRQNFLDIVGEFIGIVDE